VIIIDYTRGRNSYEYEDRISGPKSKSLYIGYFFRKNNHRDRKAQPNFITVWLHERAMGDDKKRNGDTGYHCVNRRKDFN